MEDTQDTKEFEMKLQIDATQKIAQEALTQANSVAKHMAANEIVVTPWNAEVNTSQF